MLSQEYVQEEDLSCDAEKESGKAVHLSGQEEHGSGQEKHGSGQEEHGSSQTEHGSGQTERVPIVTEHPPVVTRIILPDTATKNISCMTWAPCGMQRGFLAIGRLDGTCALVSVTPQLTLLDSKELELKSDYRSVESMHSISVLLCAMTQ